MDNRCENYSAITLSDLLINEQRDMKYCCQITEYTNKLKWTLSRLYIQLLDLKDGIFEEILFSKISWIISGQSYTWGIQ